MMPQVRSNRNPMWSCRRSIDSHFSIVIESTSSVRASVMGTALRLLGIGWFVALCIVGGVIGGLWLDGLLETGPILTLVGLGVGLAIAVAGMYHMLMVVLTDDGDATNQGKK